MLKIAFIPIDNRPVCYTLPQNIVDIDPDINLIIPDRNLLGALTTISDIGGILNWFDNLQDIDIAIISIDTIAYGGLVSSRRSTDTYEAIMDRLNRLKNILLNKKCRTYVFSSIMRISNNNINEEEKEYWSEYGTKIFDYSFNMHRAEKTLDSEANGKCVCAAAKIPPEILNDYLNTRQRNFEINKEYINWCKEGIFETLVFSKDDCAEFGLNVKEAGQLKELAADCSNVLIKTGADEIPLSLLSRAVTYSKNVKIAPVFLHEESINKISKYEDISVLGSVKSQIELAGAEVSNRDVADLILYVNNFKEQQGELVMGIYEEPFVKQFKPGDKKYFIADILNANGADNGFIEAFFENEISWDNFYGYTAWNTTGNTLGSAICAALVRFLAKNPDLSSFKKLEMIRFLDDWAYQANVRQILKVHNTMDLLVLKTKMEPFEEKLKEKLHFSPETISYLYPWDRFFEVEVNID